MHLRRGGNTRRPRRGSPGPGRLPRRWTSRPKRRLRNQGPSRRPRKGKRSPWSPPRRRRCRRAPAGRSRPAAAGTGGPPALPRGRADRRGGMGAVYKAEHRLMERTVALKVVNPAFIDNPAAVRASSKRSRRRPGCTIRISSRPTTPTRPGRCTSSSWSTSRAEASPTTPRRRGRCPFRRRVSTPGRRRWACSTPTNTAWCIGTSSRTT